MFEPASVEVGADAVSRKSALPGAMGTTHFLLCFFVCLYFVFPVAPSGWWRDRRLRLLGHMPIGLSLVDYSSRNIPSGLFLCLRSPRALLHLDLSKSLKGETSTSHCIPCDYSFPKLEGTPKERGGLIRSVLSVTVQHAC